jgi:4-hydroxyproline epimerase
LVTRVFMTMTTTQRIQVIDSHTGGEPTRVVIAGGPDLGHGTMAERLARFKREHDTFRSSIINEPRGSEVLVGALLCEAVDPDCIAGVLFFNNVGVIGMCGHGTVGLAVTLAHLGRIKPGRHRLETAVGEVGFEYHGGNLVTVENVASYRHAKSVSVPVEGGMITGDIAWGGNWFFLVEHHGQRIELKNVERLTSFTWAIRLALEDKGITGRNGGTIDHIELFGPPTQVAANSKNFVLCPGGAYDRSPCGTGTSAKLACLFEDGKLREGDIWRQESIVGSIFDCSVRLRDGKIVPSITGSAYITSEAALIVEPDDPFKTGIRA